MKAWEIVAWAYNAALYCPRCEPAAGCPDKECRDSECCPQPVFASDEGPHGGCDLCLGTLGD